MQEQTGKLLSQAEYEKLDEDEKKLCHPIPEGTKLDTIHKLQQPMEPRARRVLLRGINKKSQRQKHLDLMTAKRRAKNKRAKQSRKQQRK